MNQSSSVRTLIVVSLLSCRPSDGLTEQRRSIGFDEDDICARNQSDMLDNMLRGAVFFLTIIYTVAKNLPRSVLTPDLDLGICESSEISPDSCSCSSGSEQSECDSSSTELTVLNDEMKIELPGIVDMIGTVDRGYLVKYVKEYYTVDGDHVKEMWSRRASLWACKPRSTLQLDYRMFQTIKNYDKVPMMQSLFQVSVPSA